MDMRATMTAGIVVIVASVVSAVNGHNGAPYNWLAVLAGLTYVASIAWLRIRD